MGIQIERVSFVNFRQYGTGSLDLMPAEGTDSKLLAIVAKNGTGKTTFLNMIIWCLYGEKSSKASQEEEKLPIVNTKVLTEAKNNEEIPVSVTIRILDEEGNLIDIARSVKCTKKGSNLVKLSKPELSATYTPADGGNTKGVQGDAVNVLIKTYFDPSIYNFYFFDGEKLSAFFNSKGLKDSIYNIAQVNLVENAVRHTKRMKDDFLRKLSKDIPNGADKQNELDIKKDSLAAAENELKLETAIVQTCDEKVKDLEDSLNEFNEVKNLCKKRNSLTKEQEQLKKRKDDFLQKQNKFIREYIVRLGLYPRIKALHDYIEAKARKGKLPPAIDRDQIRKLLDHPEKPCPLCGSHLDENLRQNLRNLLQEYEISSGTSNLLSSFRSPLEEFLEDAKKYEIEKDALLDERKKLREKIEQNKKELAEIGLSISRYGGESGIQRITELNEQFMEEKEELEKHIQKKWQLEGSIKNYKNDINRLEKELLDLNKKAGMRQEYTVKYKILSTLLNNFEKVRNNIVAETRKEMQNKTERSFQEMIWKKNTFGGISIDDKYKVTIYDKEGRAMTNSVSETEKMALAYAFTLAVHDVSGKNCPLVIDSPLGRVSDENRERMARSLLQVAKDKQIIMLFTPDEYSPAVANLYDRTATVRYLSLSADESHVEGME